VLSESQINWTADEDQRLLKLVEVGKSSVFQAIKAEFEREPAEPRAKAKDK
jgi:hypothetical protein